VLAGLWMVHPLVAICVVATNAANDPIKNTIA
jgi:hypothetical protein